MAKVAIICAHCGGKALKEAGSVNRSRRNGSPVYCGKPCFGLAKRVDRSASEKQKIKHDYDRARRTQLGDVLREKKRLARLSALAENPQEVRAKEKAHREQRKQAHVEYCRQPEYRQWKAQYDQKYRARKWFGDFGEAAIILNHLETEINSRISWTERRRQNGTLNKHQQRRREYDRQTQRS